MNSVDLYIGNKKREKRKKKIRRNRRRAIVILIILFIFSYRGTKNLADLYKRVSYVPNSVTTNSNDNAESEIKSENANFEEGVSDINYRKIEGITNVLLLGLDARNNNEASRSDTIIILTIDSVHKKLKVTSIMRDTFVEIPNRGQQKINHAFAYGGAPLLMDTIEKNFNIDLDKYAIIDFNGFKHLVDLVGGLDINVEQYQIEELNKCTKELNQENPEYVTEAGVQHLTGEQVLGYSRMRHLKNDGYGRDERQREVISLLLNKVCQISILKYPKIAEEMFEYLKTNTEFTEALNLAFTVFKINNFEIEKLQIPVNELSEGVIHPYKGWILINDIEQNTKVLNNFIFEDIPYDLSNINYDVYKEAISVYYNEIENLK